MILEAFLSGKNVALNIPVRVTENIEFRRDWMKFIFINATLITTSFKRNLGLFSGIWHVILTSFGVNYAATVTGYAILIDKNYIGDPSNGQWLLNDKDVIRIVWWACYPNMISIDKFWEMQGICKKEALLSRYCHSNSSEFESLFWSIGTEYTSTSLISW